MTHVRLESVGPSANPCDDVVQKILLPCIDNEFEKELILITHDTAAGRNQILKACRHLRQAIALEQLMRAAPDCLRKIVLAVNETAHELLQKLLAVIHHERNPEAELCERLGHLQTGPLDFLDKEFISLVLLVLLFRHFNPGFTVVV